MRFIGDSISEAIDWTQDLLQTTRPIAETVLFSLLADKSAAETEDGFLLEVEDEEIKKRGFRTTQHRTRFRFSHKRGSHKLIKKQKHTSIHEKSDCVIAAKTDDDELDDDKE
jgi:hypothetical protein